jgi:hypothetical protein
VTALAALKEAGASADKALQINARKFNSPEAILTLINDAGADPKADGGKAVTEAETTLAEMRARQAKDPSLQFPTDERRRLQMMQIKDIHFRSVCGASFLTASCKLASR